MNSKLLNLKEWQWNGKTALITGITGQDGSYLTELLLDKGYKVRGIVRRSSHIATERINHLDIFDDIFGKTKESPFYLLYGELEDSTSIRRILEETKPDEIYNLGSQSHVRISFDTPESTLNMNALGPLRILESIKDMKLKCKYYQASSSEMFGISPPPQNEETPMLPQSPYGIAKLAAFHLTKMYRNAYGLFASNGILFNHESPRRGVNFVTRKITRGLAEILIGNREKIYLGNLEAMRDWGYSKEYVEAIWRILQHNEPDDFVIGTSETHTVKEFVEETFRLVGLNWEDYVEVTSRFKRPTEVPALLADSSKAKRILGWEAKTKFKDLIKIMLAADLKESMQANGYIPMTILEMPDDFYIEKAKELAEKKFKKFKS
ncbi:MAG: GDP-mannose 4,6-dehydratase [Candidatus Pacearchaeota archaeon]